MRHKDMGRDKGEREEPVNPAEVKQMTISYLGGRFGIPGSVFDNHSLYLGPKGRLYLGPSQVPPSLKIVSPGLLVARAEGGIKPSTNLFQLFGNLVSKNYVELCEGSVKKFVKGEDLLISQKERGSATDGYVLVRFRDYNLGCALLKGGTLKNQVPKAKRLGLAFV